MNRDDSQSSDLPSMPAVALKLLEALSEPDFVLDDVVDIVKCDPSLAAKLLRVANSPMYAGRSPIGDIDRAVLWLGKEAVACVSLGFALNQEISKNYDLATYYRDYWLQSVLQATAMDTLATELGFGRQGAAFTTGLLMDIGRLSLLQSVPTVYTPMVERAVEHDRSFYEVEREAYEMTHCDVSANLLAGWGMPEDMVRVVQHHHCDVETFQEMRDASAPILIAGAIAADTAEYFCGPNRGRALARIQALCQSRREFRALNIETYFELVRTNMLHAGSVFDIKLEDIPAPSTMLACAVEQLAIMAERAHAGCDDAARNMIFPTEQSAQLQDRVAAIEDRNFKDSETGLFQTAYLQARVQQRMVQYLSHDKSTSVVLVKLDQPHGTDVRSQVGKYLRESLGDGALAAPVGEDGFAVVCEAHSAEELETIARQTKEGIESALKSEAADQTDWTTSVGAVFSAHNHSQRVERIDVLNVGIDAVREAQSLGGNRVVINSITPASVS